MQIILKEQAFDPWLEAQRAQRRLESGRHEFGATALFIGTMRDFNEGEAVTGMFLEHYPGMTECQLQMLLDNALREHQVIDGLVIHRVGAINPGEPIVLVGIWASHRAEAFAACRQVIEALKSRAPFWKREQRQSGAAWVSHNTPG